MSDRYIAGVPCWVDTMQPDPEAATEFYSGLFGWELENVRPDGPAYYVARLGGQDVGAIAAIPEGAPPTAAWRTYVWVDSADETADKVRAAGGSVLMGPAEAGDFGRMAMCADPGGASFALWEAKQHRGAGLVNEPGSLNFNDLSTRDLDGARAFYGAVFGWDLLNVFGGFSAWALPAYGDFLEERTPGTRENIKAMGGPERFEEVVATAAPIPDDQPDTFPHWGVTFAVEDADAVAAKADKLGGWVVMPPFDAPWVRTTLISDPQGATFTASQFVPENKDVTIESAQAAT
jgi:predicted enzyme related to lactoylglutathione lyase